MLETEVVLDYVCSRCHHEVHVRLNCSGEGIAQGPHAVANVEISCPTCHTVSDIVFELTGLILQVETEEKSIYLEPSIN